MKNTIQTYAKILSLAALLSAAPCLASVVGSNTDVSFDGTSTSFGFGGSTFTLTDNGDFFGPVSVSTQGSAAVSSTTLFGLEPTSYFDPVRGGSLVFNDNFFQYSAFADPTVIRFSSGPTFIGLRVDLDDAFYYGYAQFAGTLLKSYGFETTPNLGIEAGAPITEVSAVPLPGALALMMSAFGLLGFKIRHLKQLPLVASNSTRLA